MNISNSLSLMRIILTLPTVYLLYTGHVIPAIIVGTLAGITDFFDGYYARKLNQITDLGKMLDPIADKAFIGLIALTMLIIDLLPLWFFIIVFARDLLILIGGLYVKNKYKIVMASNFEGKATFVMIIAVVLGVALENSYAINYGYYLCTAALIYSFGTYLFSMINVIKKHRK